MRMVAKAFPVPLGDGRDFMWFETTFDEGLTFTDAKLRRFDELIRTLIQGVVRTLQKEAQKQPDRLQSAQRLSCLVTGLGYAFRAQAPIAQLPWRPTI